MAMKKLAFYPGCALQAMTWGYRESIKHVAAALDLDLVEIENWTCCGASAAHSLDERWSVILPGRNLASAEGLGLDVAVACPMCFKRLSLSRLMLKDKLVSDPWSLKLDITIVDLARFFASEPILAEIAKRMQVPLHGLKLVCYYGCQVVRPPRVTGYSDYENPRHLDRLMTALGATVFDWSFKATCCGAGIGIPRKEIGRSLVERLLQEAHATGAQAVVVCCPLCQNNLDLYQPEIAGRKGWPWRLPVFYYSELMGIALGLDAPRLGLRSHLVDPEPVLAELCSMRGADRIRADAADSR